MPSPRPTTFMPAVLGLALVLSAAWGGLFAFVRHDRTLVEDNAYHQAENYCIAFEEYVHNIVLTVDKGLRHMEQVYVRARATGTPFEDVAAEAYAPIKVFQFALIGPDGILLYSNLNPARNRVDLSDREHFRVHLDTSDDKLFISRPVLGRVSGKWSIQFTRKITLADGSFGGVVVLSVERNEFESFFQRIDLGRRGLITLFGLDGWMRARGSQIPESTHDITRDPLPADRPYFAKDGPHRDRIRIPSFYDGVHRLGAWLWVRDVPLVVSVQLAEDEVFAAHSERANRAMAAGLILTGICVLALVVFAVLRRQRDAALDEAAASEERWRLAVDAVGDGVWDWNPASGSVFFSQRMGDIVDRPVADLPRTVPQWLESIHPDDRDAVAADFAAFLEGAPRFVHEYRPLCGTQEQKWVLDRAVVMSRDAQGRPLRVIGLRSDVTERRRLQDELDRRNAEMRRLQAALAAREISLARHRLNEAQRVARLGIIERDIAGGQWLACEHAQALLGLTPRTAYDTQALLEHAQGDLTAITALLDDSALGAINHELAIEDDGEVRYLRVVGCVPRQRDESAFITLQDISARRASEQEQARLKERMEEANRLESLGTLAGGIAHEINTPAQYVGDNLAFLANCAPDLLAVAQAAANECSPPSCPQVTQALERTNLDFLNEEVPAAIAQAQDGVRRIAKIVQAVKEFCYPSSREPQPCNLNHMIEAAATVTRTAWKYCAELELDLAPELPQLVAIEGEINQVLVNLIVNAAQAIGEKNAPSPGRIVVGTRHLDQRVQFFVADDGVGIPPERHKRIFELFYTTKPPGQGTGQGLAITAAIVRRHGGTVNVESALDQGARFTITLPVNGPLGNPDAIQAEGQA